MSIEGEMLVHIVIEVPVYGRTKDAAKVVSELGRSIEASFHSRAKVSGWKVSREGRMVAGGLEAPVSPYEHSEGLVGDRPSAPLGGRERATQAASGHSEPKQPTHTPPRGDSPGYRNTPQRSIRPEVVESAVVAVQGGRQSEVLHSGRVWGWTSGGTRVTLADAEVAEFVHRLKSDAHLREQ